jgi:methionine-rich copper-binding protein CopC
MVVGRGRNVLVGLLALVALLLGGAPAMAHSDLASSDPADGAVLATAPEVVRFTFNERLLPQGNAITLTDVAADARIEVAKASVDGDTVSVPFPAGAPAGQYRAAYRVVSADGHPIAGSITFTVGAGASPTPAGPADPSPVASSPAAPGAPAATGAPGADPSLASPLPAALPDDAGDAGDAGMLVWALAIGVVVLAAVGGATWYARRSR